MSIKFMRQPDGSFTESGDLPVGTRTVRVFIDGVRPPGSSSHPAKEYLKFIRNQTETTPQFCRGDIYEIKPEDVDAPELIAKRVKQLTDGKRRKNEQ